MFEDAEVTGTVEEEITVAEVIGTVEAIEVVGVEDEMTVEVEGVEEEMTVEVDGVEEEITVAEVGVTVIVVADVPIPVVRVIVAEVEGAEVGMAVVPTVIVYGGGA
jgi:hypothetical protein